MLAVVLVGCARSQPAVGAAGVLPQTGAMAPHAERSRSWIAPEAKSEDLLYISDVYGVHIFSYPTGQHVGDITGFASPAGLCTDQKGDVFVTDTPSRLVYEFAHGSTKVLQTLGDIYVDFGPIDCSVDSATGNLAVASADAAFVVIFPKAKQNPKVYYVHAADAHMFFCAYDNKGDLFVDQIANGSNNYIGELPKGGLGFETYLLDQRIAPPGGIQFDGKHVTIEALQSEIVYRLRFRAPKAIIVGTTPLDGTTSVEQYWIQGKTLVGPDENSTVFLWKYPRGGSPVSSIQGFTEPYGSTVSTGPWDRHSDSGGVQLLEALPQPLNFGRFSLIEASAQSMSSSEAAYEKRR